LDRILDRYDGDGVQDGGDARGGGSEADKKYTPPKVDKAAQLLASCMTAGGTTHRLRKSIGLYLD